MCCVNLIRRWVGEHGPDVNPVDRGKRIFSVHIGDTGGGGGLLIMACDVGGRRWRIICGGHSRKNAECSVPAIGLSCERNDK